MSTQTDWLIPEWPAPPRVKACSTTRNGGVSEGRFASLNLAAHVEDDVAAVKRNREILQATLSIPREPVWLSQVHGVRVVDAAKADIDTQADASFSRQSGVACVVMTADCLPVLFTDREGSVVASAHAGWRGLLGGVLEQTVAAMQVPPENILAWFGPAIGPENFEVGDEVRDAYLKTDEDTAVAFLPSRPGHWWADIYELARLRLNRAGVRAMYGGGLCTFADPDRFYSYRRDHVTGRMASLIWMQIEA